MGRNKRGKTKKNQAEESRSTELKRFLLIHADWSLAAHEEKKAHEWRVTDMQGVTATMIKAKSKDAIYRHYLRKPPKPDGSWEEKLDELFPGFPSKTAVESKAMVESLLQMERKTDKPWDGGDPLLAFLKSSEVVVDQDPDYYVSLYDFNEAFSRFCTAYNVPKGLQHDEPVPVMPPGCKVVTEKRWDPARQTQPPVERGWVVGCTLRSLVGTCNALLGMGGQPRSEEGKAWAMKNGGGAASAASAVNATASEKKTESSSQPPPPRAPDAIDRLSSADAEFLWCWLNAASSSHSDDIPEKHREQYQIVEMDEIEEDAETIQ